MTPSNSVERITLYSVPIDLSEAQVEIVADELETVLIGLTQDLAYLDGKPDPAGYVEEVAAYGRLAAAVKVGTLFLPDRACRKAIERLAEELDGRYEYERARAAHEAFAAFAALMKKPRPAVTRGRR